MRRWIGFGLLVFLALPAVAVDGREVKYVGGTVAGVTSGAIGRLDTTTDAALIFEHAGTKVAIPYDAIQSFDYSHEVAHHLGVLPLIAISLFRARQHRHFFRISYRGQGDVTQVVVFEVPKQMPRTLRVILEARQVPSTPESHRPYSHSYPCKPCSFGD
jgi:hypothetical protein